MRYKAKCNGCGRDFIIDTKGKQEVRCSCPYCGKQLTVCLTTNNNKGVVPKANKGVASRKGNGSALKIFITALLVVVVGLLAGGLTWYVYQQNESERMLAHKLKEARRKAHQDSLAQIRAAQDVRRLGEEQEYIKQKSVENFLKSFLLDAILGTDNANAYMRNVTANCCETLHRIYGKDNDTYESLASWIYASGKDHVDIGSLRKYFQVAHYSGDWYRVSLVQHGVTEYKYVKIIFRNGDILIDDVR